MVARRSRGSGGSDTGTGTSSFGLHCQRLRLGLGDDHRAIVLERKDELLAKRLTFGPAEGKGEAKV